MAQTSADTIVTIVFGLVATFLALVAVAVAYCQLRVATRCTDIEGGIHMGHHNTFANLETTLYTVGRIAGRRHLSQITYAPLSKHPENAAG